MANVYYNSTKVDQNVLPNINSAINSLNKTINYLDKLPEDNGRIKNVELKKNKAIAIRRKLNQLKTLISDSSNKLKKAENDAFYDVSVIPKEIINTRTGLVK